MNTWLAIYICLSGPTCPKVPIVSTQPKYSEPSCESAARLVAQGMYVQSGDKYGYRCERVEYEPPRVPR